MADRKIDIFRKSAGIAGVGEKSKKTELQPEAEAIVAKTTEEKKKTKILAIEVLVDDLPKFDSALVKLSSRDDTLYKRKDIYIAMARYFFEAIDKNIDKIKIEKH